MTTARKNIVICSDGTGNSANKGRGTNVFKLFEAIDVVGHAQRSDACEQVAIYDDGVGTQKVKVLRLAAGAVGFGLASNVRQLYAELARVFRPGDRVLLFGFSRGAFTVRTLAGFIDRAGILQSDGLSGSQLSAAVGDLYRAYRKSHPALLEYVTSPMSTKLRQVWRWLVRRMTGAKPPTLRFHEDKSIRFVGVWDTVDAVGFPIPGAAALWNHLIHHFKFTDPGLPENVHLACHALAIDEERASFAPFLWRHEPDRTEQVWFAGVHSNVGGGYPKQGMSLVTLDWMMKRAKQASDGTLRFASGLRTLYGEAPNVNDTLYDSRAGLAVYYRYKPRDIAALCRQVDAPVHIHASAMARIENRTRGYAPVTLPRSFAIVDATDADGPIQVGSHPADSDRTFEGDDPSADGLGSGVTTFWVRWRQITQSTFFATQIGLLSLAILCAPDAEIVLPEEWLPAWFLGAAEIAVAPIPGAFAQQWLVWPMFAFPALGFTFVAALVTSYLFGLIGRVRVEHHSAERWHRPVRSRKA